MKRKRNEANEDKAVKSLKINVCEPSQEKWDIVYQCETFISEKDEAHGNCQRLIALLEKLKGTVMPPIGANRASSTLAAFAIVHDKRKFFDIVVGNGQHKYMCSSTFSTAEHNYKIYTPLMIATLGKNIDAVDSILANKYFRANPDHQMDIKNCIDLSKRCIESSRFFEDNMLLQKLKNARS